MLADEHSEIGVRGPEAVGGPPVGIAVFVTDVDARSVVERAKVLRPVENCFYGDRSARSRTPSATSGTSHTR
jgi:PhnB protein